MKDLGPAEYILGIQIIRDPDGSHLRLSQRAYLESVLRRFNMQDCAPVQTPMEPGLKLEMLPATQQPADVPYQAAIGSLMYAMLGTRPDLAYSVSYLSRFAARPSHDAWKAVKRVMRYIRGTLDYGLVYCRSQTTSRLLGYSDADWSNCPDSSRSVSGYTFMLAGGAVSWASARQPCVALSSTEAEYIALTEAAKEAIWLRTFFAEIGRPLSAPLDILGDNQGAIALGKNPEFHKRTKHIRRRYHFIREAVDAGDVHIAFVPTRQMVADVLTKAMSRDLHSVHRSGLGVLPMGL
jgi:hypothetical protein